MFYLKKLSCLNNYQIISRRVCISSDPLDEASKLKKLDHRNVVKVHDVILGTSVRLYQYVKDKELHKEFQKKFFFLIYI